jgi:hypothetical protein
MAKAAAEARAISAMPAPKVVPDNPVPQSDPDAPPGIPPAVLPQPGGTPVGGGPAPQLLPSLLPVAILSQDEQNMASSLDDTELLHLEEMLRLAKSARRVQTPDPTVPGTGEQAPQVNSQGEAPHAINEHPDTLLE